MSRVDGFGSSSVASGNARFGGDGAARPSKQQPSASINRSQMNSDFCGGSGGGSKRNVGGGSKSIQVIFNGKIVTPLSLIPQKVIPPACNPAAAAAAVTAGTNNNNYNLNANTTNINSSSTSTNNAAHSNTTNTNSSNLTTNPTGALISNALLNKSTSQRQKMNAPSIGKIDENTVEYDAVSTGTGAAGNSTKMGKGGNANKKNRVLRSNQFGSVMEETLLYINQTPLKSHDFSTQTSKNKCKNNSSDTYYDDTDIDNDYEDDDDEEDDFNRQVVVKAGNNGVSDENDFYNYSTVILSETETITILDIPSFVVNKEPIINSSGINNNNKTAINNENVDNSNITEANNTDSTTTAEADNKVETDVVTQLITRNQAYGLIHERHLSAPDSFTSHTTQTLNDAQKNQNDMTNVIALIDIGCQASSYAIIDETRMYDDNYGDEYDADTMSARKSAGGGLTSVTSGSGTSSNMTTTGTNTDGSSGGVIGDGKIKTIIINATNNDNNYKKQQTMSTSTSIGTSTSSTSTEIPSVKKFVSDSVNIALMSSGCLLDMYFQKRAVSPQKSGGAHLNKSSKHRQTGMSGMMGSQAGGTSFMGSSHYATGSESSGVINTHGHAAVTRATGGGGVTGVGASSSRAHGGGGGVSGSHFMSGTSDNSRTGGGVSGTSRVGGMSGVSHASGYSDSPAAGPGPGFEYHFGPNPTAPIIPTSLEGDALLRDKEAKRILTSTALITQLNIIERAVLQNIYYQKQLQFRHIEETTCFDITDLIIESRNDSRRNSANNSKNHSDNEIDDDDNFKDNDEEDDDDMKIAFLNAKQNMMKSRSVKNILDPSSPVSNKSTRSTRTHTADVSGHSIMASNKSGGSMAMNLIGGTGLALSRSLSNKNFNANLSRSASNKNLNRGASNKNFTLTSNISSTKLLQTIAQQPASEKIKRLFRYANVDIVTTFREVSCMIYNPSDTSLLAVGYTPSALLLHHSLTTGASANNNITSVTTGFGSMSGTSATATVDSTAASASGAVLLNTDENRQKGIVLFWSPRNPQYPEKILYTPYGVTSLAFSTLNPLLLAVGMNNGDIAIYDMRRGKNEWMMPMEVSTHVIGGHSETVCQLKWVVRGTNSAASATADSNSTSSHSTSVTAAAVVPVQEDLVSVSTDGLVLQWSLKKGFTVATLMKLKRGASGEGWLSRLSAGLCFDFPSDDPSTYLVGTEEGSLHRCSVSYNEQTLETYVGHNGPLNQVKFSPFCSHVFLTCSSDWTIGLYRVSNNAPLAKLQGTGQSAAVHDVAWCPGNSTVFAAVTQEAQLQIWDLSESHTEPLIVYDTLHDDQEAALDYQSLHAAANMNGLLFTGDGSRINSAASHTSSHSALRYALMSSGSSNSSFDRDRNNATGTLISSSSPVIKLVDNLVQTKKDATLKSLTSVLFSSGTHTVAVGDSLGGVTIYSITEDIAMIQDMNVMKDILNSSKKMNNNNNTNPVENNSNITNNSATGYNAIAIDNINNPIIDWKVILAEQRQRMDDVVELLTEPTNVNNKKQHQQQGTTQRG